MSFGCDYIFFNRDHSADVVARAVAIVSKQFRDESITVENYQRGRLICLGKELEHRLINERLNKISSVAAPLKSATLARVVFAGDDGYGQGTVGDLTLPVNQRRTNGGYPELH